MKEMIYSEIQKRTILDNGTYKGYKYWIISLGTHPVAYIQTEEKIVYSAIEDIYVHGGITYNKDHLILSKDEILKGNFIGWDYNHYNDYNGMMQYITDITRKWTTEEILEDVKDVVRQIIRRK